MKRNQTCFVNRQTSQQGLLKYAVSEQIVWLPFFRLLTQILLTKCAVPLNEGSNWLSGYPLGGFTSNRIKHESIAWFKSSSHQSKRYVLFKEGRFDVMQLRSGRTLRMMHGPVYRPQTVGHARVSLSTTGESPAYSNKG